MWCSSHACVMLLCEADKYDVKAAELGSDCGWEAEEERREKEDLVIYI